MARKYKRKSNGQFAGGGGSAGSTAKGGGKKGAKAKPKAETNSKAQAKSLAKIKRVQRRNKVIMFAARNPQLVVGAVGSATVLALNGKQALNAATAAKKVSNSNRFANDMKAALRGISSTVGSSGLKAKKQNRKGVYKL